MLRLHIKMPNSRDAGVKPVQRVWPKRRIDSKSFTHTASTILGDRLPISCVNVSDLVPLLSTHVSHVKDYFLAGKGRLSSRLLPVWWWLRLRWSATAPGLHSACWPAACPPPGTAGPSPYTPPRHSGQRDTSMNCNMSQLLGMHKRVWTMKCVFCLMISMIQGVLVSLYSTHFCLQ